MTIPASLPPVGPPPAPGANLTACLGDDVNVAPVALAVFTPTLVGTNFNHAIGFYAMHPVLAFANGRYSCKRADTHGNIDLSNNAHFIYTLRHYPSNGVQFWTTSLVTHLSLTFGCVINAIWSCMPLPHAFIDWGGRDGLLISSTDPTTEEVLNEWFTMPDKSKLAGYAEQIQHTPLEYHTEFHQRALEHWEEIPEKERGKYTSKMKEPTPYDHNGV
jgi:hypothetical protein